MQLTGIHHLTAVTANAIGNKDFYTNTLGLRLVKKTVNQDDVSAYHLFYADGLASPGTDITFFDWSATRERRGTNSIVRTAFRIDRASFAYWLTRFDDLKVSHSGIVELDGRSTIEFEDQEGQRLALVADDNKLPVNPWEHSPVEEAHQLRGLGPITISIPELKPTEQILTNALNMEMIREYAHHGNDTFVFKMGDGGTPAELHVKVEPKLSPGRPGAGAVHHVAFRVPTFAEYDLWAARLQELRLPSSGPVDRFYFRSLYFREPGGILFELATDGPGFAADESMETLGQKLSLPPFLENRRAEIEAQLKPL